MARVAAMKWPLVVAAIAVVIGAAGCGESKTAAVKTVTIQPTTTDEPVAAPPPAPPPPPAPASKPDADYTSNCSYILGDFSVGPKGYRLVADATVTNTGNVGIVAELRVAWKQAGSAPIRRKKSVRVPFGGRRDIGITVQITQNEIDLIQAASTPDCTAKVAIVDTFGRTHEK